MRAINVQFRTKFSAGLLPPLRQTAQLCVRAFVESVVRSTTLSACTPLSVQYSNPLPLHYRAILNFQISNFIRYHYIIGLHSIFKSATFSATTTLSGCTQFSNQQLFPPPLHYRAVLNFKISYSIRFHYIFGMHSLFKSGFRFRFVIFFYYFLQRIYCKLCLFPFC